MSELCQCGCGQPAPLAPYSDRSRGYVKGQPLRFIAGHHLRLRRSPRTWTETPGPMTTPCWLWDGQPTAQGYGTLVLDGVHHMAHRWVWEQRVGDIPPGAELDHLCRVRNCVNPEHLEPVVHRTNVIRGVGPTAANSAKTHCKHGHPLSGDNLRIAPNGRRVCRKCERRASREKMRRKMADPEKRADFNAYRKAWRASKKSK